jgi:serine/threonine protein kinase
MALVRGRTLDEIIARRSEGAIESEEGHWMARLEPAAYMREAARCLHQIARAVEAAHAAGIAHRDIKPANILIADDCARRCAYLIDFGMGRDLDVATLEQLRDWSGSPVYMAPEKLQGRHEDEKLCDIYSLGATLYEALTLRPMTTAPSGLTVSKLWAYLLHAAPSAPSFGAGERVCPALRAIVRRATAERPGERFRTAGSFAAALERHLVPQRRSA